MIRYTKYLTLVACVMAVPSAVAQQPSQGAQYSSRPTGDRSAAARAGGGSERAVEVILKASGVPNRNGRVVWPLGLRLLRAKSQRQQLEAQLQLTAEQVTGGGANPKLLDEIRHSVEALRRLLLEDRERRVSMPPALYREAERFLDKLKKTPQILAVSAPVGRSNGEDDSASAPPYGGAGSARAAEGILKASRVRNQNDQVAWPLGLRLLRTESQRQQLEAQLQLAAEQVTGGGVNPKLLDEIRHSIEDLRRLLLADKERRVSMPAAVYEDAERFLQKFQGGAR
jgi:hypothetical protein